MANIECDFDKIFEFGAFKISPKLPQRSGDDRLRIRHIPQDLSCVSRQRKLATFLAAFDPLCLVDIRRIKSALSLYSGSQRVLSTLCAFRTVSPMDTIQQCFRTTGYINETGHGWNFQMRWRLDRTGDSSARGAPEVRPTNPLRHALYSFSSELTESGMKFSFACWRLLSLSVTLS